ncbi:MAG: hypothetical protein R6X16_16265, partial [Anaerolineae bacterium]
PHEVGYLHYCLLAGLGEGEPGKIQVAGNADPAALKRDFEPHSTIASQRHWHVAGAERYL